MACRKEKKKKKREAIDREIGIVCRHLNSVRVYLYCYSLHKNNNHKIFVYSER